MVYQVWHAVNPNWDYPWRGKAPQWPAEYAMVARVEDTEADDVDDVYRLTNSIDDYWGYNKGVFPQGGPHRSTSMGDVVVLPDGETAMRCERCGWAVVSA